MYVGWKLPVEMLVSKSLGKPYDKKKKKNLSETPKYEKISSTLCGEVVKEKTNKQKLWN